MKGREGINPPRKRRVITRKVEVRHGKKEERIINVTGSSIPNDSRLRQEATHD
jgi:hypothetical protein